MPTKHPYEYAVIRVTPRVEREEFLNVGVIVFCKEARYLRACVELDEERLSVLHPEADVASIRKHLNAIESVAAGRDDAGPIGRLSPRERFLILVAPRSTIIQTSAVHTGWCGEPEATLERLMDQMVRVTGAEGGRRA